MIVAPLPAEDIDKFWPLLEWAFVSFSERTDGDVTPDELKDDVREAAKQCWVALEGTDVRAVGLTEVQAHGRRVWFNYCAGRGREDWQTQMVEEIEAWSKRIGARGVRTYSRTGWTPFLRDMGYRETHRIMEKSHV